MSEESMETAESTEYVSSFEQEVADNSPAATATSEPAASPASAGLASETAGTPAAKALGTPPVKGEGGTAPQSQPVDLVAALEKMLAEESGAKPQAAKLTKEAELAKMLEGIQPGTPADQRIRALANARAEAQDAAAQVQTQVQQMQTYVQQMQQTAQAEIQRRDQMITGLQSQMQAMTANFEALKTLAPKPPVDPADQIRQQWQDGMQDILKSREQEWEQKRLAPVVQRLEAIEQANKAAETKQVSQRYYNEALQAVDAVTMRGLKEFLPAEVAKEAAPELAAYALARVLNTGCSYQEAAGRLRHTILNLSAAFVRAASKGTQSALSKGKEVPTLTTSRRVDGQGSAMPSLDKLHEMGFRDELEFIQAQDSNG